MDKQMLGAVVITVALGAAVAGAEVLLINEMVEAEQRTEVRFDAPPACVITGLGFRAAADNITTMHVRCHEVSPDGTLRNPKEVRLGSEPEHGCEAKVWLPEGYAAVGFGARGAPEWDVTTLRVWARKVLAGGKLGKVEVFEDGSAPKHGVEREVHVSADDRVLSAAGLRYHVNDIAGIYARSRQMLALDEPWRERIKGRASLGWVTEHSDEKQLAAVVEAASKHDAKTLEFAALAGRQREPVDQRLQTLAPAAANAKAASIGVWLTVRASDELSQEMFTLPGLAGIVLQFGEERAAKTKRMSKLQQAVKLCKKHDVSLAVRFDRGATTTWLTTSSQGLPADVRFVKPCTRGLRSAPLKGRPPFQASRFADIVEFDLAGLRRGGPLLPNIDPDWLQRHVTFNVLHGATAILARIDAAGRSIMGTPNEFDLFVMKKLTEDPCRPIEPLWQEYFSRRYGEAALPVIRALKRTASAIELIYTSRGLELLSTRRGVAKVADAERTVADQVRRLRGLARDESAEHELLSPTSRTITEAMDEKATALWLIQQCIADIETAKGKLSKKDYEELHALFARLETAATIWSELTRAYLLCQLYWLDCSDATLSGLRECLKGVSASAQRIKARPDLAAIFGDVDEFIKSVEERITKTRQQGPLTLAMRNVESLEKAGKHDEAAASLAKIIDGSQFREYLGNHGDRLGRLASSLRALGSQQEDLVSKRGGDGKWRIEKKAGKWAWRSAEGGPCIYFDLVKPQTETPADYELSFEYYDSPADAKLYVHYDSDYSGELEERQYHPAEPIVLAGTEKWKSASLHLTRCLFNGGQNLQADLRFIQNKQPMRIRAVRLTKK